MIEVVAPQRTSNTVDIPQWVANPAAPLSVNDPTIRAFLAALSQRLLTAANCRGHSEIIALGFWLRPANLIPLIAKATSASTPSHKLPLGLVVHYAPQNVDTLFVYSWVCALLMGNTNIIRLSSSQSQTQRIIMDHIEELLNDPVHLQIAQRNLFVQFSRDAAIGRTISKAADARVIWGGDDSVTAIRNLPCKPRCRDICFADRHSAAIVNGHSLTSDQIPDLAKKLWRDMEPFNQQACSSPRIIYWLGKNDYVGQLVNTIDLLAMENTDDATNPSDNNRLEQLVHQQYVAGYLSNFSTHDAKITQLNSINTIELPQTTKPIWLNKLLEEHPGCRSLFLIQIEDTSSLTHLLDAKTQTLTHFGFDEPALLEIASNQHLPGVDRIVPVGNALTFDPTWDGFELLTHLSRTRVIGVNG